MLKIASNRLPQFIETRKNLSMSLLPRNRDLTMRPLPKKPPKKTGELIYESGASRQSNQSTSMNLRLSVIAKFERIDAD
jgi:hypothetical protein